ncbi:hypothetical protein [Lactovum odontotermitis]
MAHQRFNTQNVQSAYEKLKDGSFSETELNSADWKNLEASYEPTPDGDGKIIITSDLQIGKDVNNSEENAQRLLQLLPVNFIQYLSGRKNDPTDMVSFYSPGNKGLLYTNNQGKAEGNFAAGWTAVYLGTQFIKYVNLTDKNASIKIDISNSSDDISIKLLGDTQASSDENGLYTVEYGQVVKYQFTIKKEFLTGGASVDINMPSNLYIDDISVPNTLVSDAENPIDTSTSQQPSDSLGQKMNTAVRVIDEKLDDVSLNHYHIDIDADDKDFTAEISAHIVSSNSMTVPVVLETGAEVRDVTVHKTAYLPDKSVIEKNQQYLTKNFKIKVTAQNKMGQAISATSRALGSSGMNFLIYNADKSTAAEGAEFILGKTEAGKNYGWSSQGGWIEIPADLAQADLSALRSISGGSRYILDDMNDEALPTNSRKWTYNAEDEKLSHSVIQIYGLGQGQDYFLYQLKAADGQSENHKKYNFQVSRQLVAANGENGVSVTTSLGEAKQQDDHLNLLLPDYMAGVNEYNLVSVSSKEAKSSSRSTFSLIFPIVLIVLVLILLTIVLVIKR